MICKYVESFDFPDHKGWDAMLGMHAEGQITWIGEDHELVADGSQPTGFAYQGYVPNWEAYGAGFATFTEAARALENAIFGDQA